MRISATLVSCLVFFSFVQVARAEIVRVAVASNFLSPAREIASLFTKESGDDVELIAGQSGLLYTQIISGAPFHIFLSADDLFIDKCEKEGYGAIGTRFIYATGQLALWHKDEKKILGEETLREANFSKLALSNPINSPYGKAAYAVLDYMNLYKELEHSLVQAESIAQAFAFVASGNANLGFVAFSQTINAGGASWLVPQKFYPSLHHHGILLRQAIDNKAAQQFFSFLKKKEAHMIIKKYGYRLDG